MVVKLRSIVPIAVEPTPKYRIPSTSYRQLPNAFDWERQFADTEMNAVNIQEQEEAI